MLDVQALTYIRGRSLPRQFLIIDEAQNLTLHEAKTIITRAGEGTKVIMTGDLGKMSRRPALRRAVFSARAKDRHATIDRCLLVLIRSEAPGAGSECTSGCQQLAGGRERYRVRQGRYRIVYSIQDHELTVWVVKVAHRKDVYR